MNKKTVFLHIGMHKTGTTSIQHFLHKNTLFLQQKGLYYPTMDGQEEQIINCFPFFRNWEEFESYKFRDIQEDEFDTIKEIFKKRLKETFLTKIENCKQDKILLSDEGMGQSTFGHPRMHYGHLESMPCFYKALEELGFIVKIIVYIRTSADYLASRWQQYVKFCLSDAEPCLDTWLETYHPYMEKLVQFIEIIGKENVILKAYEKCQWKNNNLIEDFLDIFDIKIPERLLEDTRINENPSAGRNLSELFTIIPFFEAPERNKIIAKLIALNEPDIKVIESLTDEQILNTLEKYKPYYTKLATMFGKESLFVNEFPSCYGNSRVPFDKNKIVFTKEQLLFAHAAIQVEQENYSKIVKSLYNKVMKYESI